VQQRFRDLDWSILALLAIVAFALWPFLSRPGLPRFTDAELHVYRLAELARLVSAGELYPRWAPNFYFGYGYPIFNYYAPLSYYAGLPVALLPWWDAVTGVRAVFIGGMLAGALGTFALARTYWGSAAGLVAAAAYSFSPYVLYVDPHARGDLAESLALGIFPLALWAVDRLRHGRAGAWLLAAALVAAVILSHNLLALVSFGLLLAYALWQCSGREAPRADCTLRLGALLAGVGLAAFFWLPVALEQDAVNLDSLIGPGGHFDFRNHFLTIARLLAPPARLDWAASEPAFPLNLGLSQWLLATGSVILLATGSVRHRRHAAFFAVASIGLLAMMLPYSAPVWETVPLLPYFQFPWRLLGAVAPLLAILVGAGTDALSRRIRGTGSHWVPALLVTAIVVTAFPLLQVPPWTPERWDTSAWGVLEQELRGRWLGTTSTADFVPATVDVIPGPTGQLLEAIRAGEVPDRVNRATLPEGASVHAEPLRPLHTRYRVSSPVAFPLRLYQFAFPGWEVRVDGEVMATEVGRPEGFLVAPLPAGIYTVDVELVATPAQRAAWLVSLFSLLASLAAALMLRRKAALGPAPAGPVLPLQRGTLHSRSVLAVVVLLAIAYAVLSASGRLHVQSTGFQAIPAQHDLFASFDGEIALIGYDAPSQARRGTPVAVTLYWKAQHDVAENYQVFVHLTRAGGTVLAQSDKLNPGEFPTRRWSLDHYVRDEHRITLPADLAPGEYTLSAGLWLQAEQRRLAVVDERGVVSGDVVTLGPLIVRD
jgi:hypothetical protein